jgi:Amt family ammonium transporter
LWRFGTLLVGVFATDGGLLYGGGFEQLGIQAIGVLAIELGQCRLLYRLIILKKTMGLSNQRRRNMVWIFMSCTNVYNA